MNSAAPPSCPQCGSQRLITQQSAQRMIVGRDGAHSPLLTIHHLPSRPVIEKNTTLYICSCSWNGTEEEF